MRRERQMEQLAKNSKRIMPEGLERKGFLWYHYLNWVGYARLVLMPAEGGGSNGRDSED